MANLLLFVGGLVLPATAGAAGYPIWLIFIWAAVLHLIARSRWFRAFGGFQPSPDTSSAPVLLFLSGWLISLLPMLAAYGLGWVLAWLF